MSYSPSPSLSSSSSSSSSAAPLYNLPVELVYKVCNFLDPRDICHWSYTSKDLYEILNRETYRRAVHQDVEDQYPGSLLAATLHSSTTAFKRLLELTPPTYASKALNKCVPLSVMRKPRAPNSVYAESLVNRARHHIIAAIMAEMPHAWDEVDDNPFVAMMDMLLKGNGKPGWYVDITVSNYTTATIHGSCEMLDLFIDYDKEHDTQENLEAKVEEAYEESFAEGYEYVFEHLVDRGFKPNPSFLERSVWEQNGQFFDCMIDAYDYSARTLESCFESAVEGDHPFVVDSLLMKGVKPSFNVLRATLRSTNKDMVAQVIQHATKEDLLSRRAAGAAQLLGQSSSLRYAKQLLAQCPELATVNDNNTTNVINEIYAAHDVVHLPIAKLLINRGALVAETTTMISPLALRRILRQRHIFVLKAVLARRPALLNNRTPEMRNLFRALLPADSMTTQRANDMLECIKYLKKHGRDLHEENFSWATVMATAKPLHNCQTDIQGLNDLMWYLMQNGSKVAYDDLANCPRSLMGEIAIPLLRESGKVLTPEFKTTIAAAFRFACRRGSWESVDGLLGLFPRLATTLDPETGDTPLHLAIQHFIDDFRTANGYVEMIGSLLLGCHLINTYHVPILVHNPFLIKDRQHGRSDKCNPIMTIRDLCTNPSIPENAKNNEGKTAMDFVKEATERKDYDWDALKRSIDDELDKGDTGIEAVRTWAYAEYRRLSNRDIYYM